MARAPKPNAQIVKEVIAIIVIDTPVDKEATPKIHNHIENFHNFYDPCETSIMSPIFEDSQNKKLEFWKLHFKKPLPEIDKPNS